MGEGSPGPASTASLTFLPFEFLHRFRRDAATDGHAFGGHLAGGDTTGDRCDSCDKPLSHDNSRIAWAGGLGQTAGYAVEAYVLERLPKLLSRRFGFIETSAMPESFTHPDGSIDEIDVIVRGTIDGRPVAFVGETKTNITLREVEDFLKVVGRVRPAMQCDDVRAIFFAYRASGDARQAVAAVGCSLAFPHDIIVQPG